MFSKKEDAMFHRVELSNIVQYEDESIEEFGKRVRQTATKAYMNVSDDIFELMSREAFLKGCTNKSAAELALFKDPETLDEAIKYTRKAAQNHRIINRSNRSKVRTVSFKNDVMKHSTDQKHHEYTFSPNYKNDFKELKESLSEISSCLAILTNKNKESAIPTSKHSQFKSPPRITKTSPRRQTLSPLRNRSQSPVRSPIRCFRCNCEGHFAKNCPVSSQKSSQGNLNQ